MKPILVEHTFDVSVQKLWQAITDHSQMVRWFFENIPEFEAATGFKTSFPVQSGDRTFTHEWEILEAIPGKRIKYKWCYGEYDGKGYVTFELLEKGTHTVLKLTSEGLETSLRKFPNSGKKAAGPDGNILSKAGCITLCLKKISIYQFIFQAA